jgi:hypothetical protein
MLIQAQRLFQTSLLKRHWFNKLVLPQNQCVHGLCPSFRIINNKTKRFGIWMRGERYTYSVGSLRKIQLQSPKPETFRFYKLVLPFSIALSTYRGFPCKLLSTHSFASTVRLLYTIGNNNNQINLVQITVMFVDKKKSLVFNS